MTYELYYEGEIALEGIPDKWQAVLAVQEHYRAYEPYLSNDEFNWDGYELKQVVDIDFKQLITTQRSIPRSHRAEGNNFVD